MPLQYGEEVDVADWFASFCTVFSAEEVLQTGNEEEKSPAKKARRGRPRGSKKVFRVCCSTALKTAPLLVAETLKEA